jgi:menaquinone-dependent protoporphyrinogen IX oxidase
VQAVEGNMRHTLVLYVSKYGLTESVARDLALVLGPARSVRADQFQEAQRAADFVVLAAPAYQDVIDPRMLAFVQAKVLKDRPQRPMPALELSQQVEAFLTGHNT